MKGKILGVIILLILIIGGLYLGGYVQLFEGATIEQFNSLKEQYGFEKHYSTDLDELNDYSNDLSLLRAKAVGNLALTMDVELAHAKSLYYLSKALQEEKSIPYTASNCNKSLSFKNSISFLELSISSAEQGLTSYDLVIDKSNIRKNQKNILQEFLNSSKKIKKDIINKC